MGDTNASRQSIRKVAVLGGGITGLAAAHWLLDTNQELEVALFEASGRVGGVIETVQTGDYLVERGADNFATMIPDALELSKLCGIDQYLIRPASENRQALVACNGQVQPIPAGFSLMQPTRIGSILATRTLSLNGKLRLLGEFFVARRTDVSDESLESFAVRRLGREAYENLVEPIVGGIFTADPKTLSMAATMPQFLEMERDSGGLIRGFLSSKKKDAVAAARRASGARYDQFMAPTGGMSSWIEALASKLPQECLKLNSPVDRIRPLTGDRWEIACGNTAADFDAVICALPAKQTAKLLRDSDAEAANLVQSVGYASSAVVAMVLNRADIEGRLDAFGLIVPSKAGRAALAISYTSNKYPGRTPHDEILLRVFMGGALRPEFMQKSDAEIESVAQHEVRELLQWSGKSPNWQAVVRWEEAMPQYRLGHIDRMQQLDVHLQKFPTLKLCGAAYRGVGIPQCVRGARQAVAELLGGKSE